jgi:hypothetical protein
MKVYFTVEEALGYWQSISDISIPKNIDFIPRIGETVFIDLDPLREKIIKLGIDAHKINILHAVAAKYHLVAPTRREAVGIV